MRHRRFFPLIKGIRDQGELERALGRCAKASSEGLVQLETDMRAHGNPTRLRVLRTLAFRLVRRVASPCPACSDACYRTTRIFTDREPAEAGG